MRISPTIKTIFLLWLILWLIAFIFIPSRVDFIHGFTAGNFESFPQKLENFRFITVVKDLAQSLGGVGLVTLAYLSLGSFLLGLFPNNLINDEEESFSAWLGLFGTMFVCGHALFSFVIVLLGANHLFYPNYLGALLLAGGGIGIPSLVKFLSNYPHAPKENLFEQWRHIKFRTFFILSAGIMFLALLYSSSRLSYDAVAIYFSDEKLTALTNKIQFFQDNSFTASSFQTGITYGVLINIIGDQAARLYSWVNGLIIILFSLAIGQKLGLSINTRLITIILLVTSTAFIDLTGDGKIDLISTVPAIAATYWAIVNSTKQNRSISLLVGILAGVSIVSRPFNAFLVCFFTGTYYTIIFMAIKNTTDRFNILKSISWLALGMFIPITSHLIVNQVILGDPLAFLHNLQTANSSNWQWTFDPKNLWVIRLLYPFALTIINIPQSNGNISPLFVALLPVIFYKKSRLKLLQSKLLIQVVIAAIITLALWITLLFTVFEIRYVLFLWIILYMALATIVDEFLSNTDKSLQRIVEMAILITLVFASIRMIYIAIDTYSPVDKENAPHCYDHDLCALLDPINSKAKAGERVLTLSAFRYYLRPDLLACSSRYDEYESLLLLENGDPTLFWNEVYRLGFKYITYEPRYSRLHLGLNFVPADNNMPNWMELRPIITKPGGYAAYEIVTTNPPLVKIKTCIQINSDTWNLQNIH